MYELLKFIVTISFLYCLKTGADETETSGTTPVPDLIGQALANREEQLCLEVSKFTPNLCDCTIGKQTCGTVCKTKGSQYLGKVNNFELGNYFCFGKVPLEP